ncbi:MAG: family 20 glycosylhydrolase [Oscillospiraceae bacterium]|nr:family 20 glycosylhydrolase [Oscillospiraceae bacterium]MBQ7118803.1 family 20 glycosylhydrolase [Oscillospiraceae bacterium]
MIFPRVQKIEKREGRYRLKTSCKEISLLAFFNKIKEGNDDIKIEKKPLFGTEEYSITVDAGGITIGASCEVGIYRAVTSLLQLIKKSGDTLDFIYIEDKPELSRRGYMLDISRGRMPKVSEIKKLIDYLSGLKYNELQLYMEGECFKYNAFPEYTENFDCLTEDDIKELEAYCEERFIDLVPNQNSLGHLENWFKFDEFKHLCVMDGENQTNTINPFLPESFEFISKLYDSLLPNFKSEYVNIGLDEAYGLGKGETKEFCDKNGKDILFMQWLSRLNEEVGKKHGKKVMFWSDMIYKSEKLYEMIPKDSVILEWGYELIQSQLMTEHCIMFKNAGLNYYVCPSVNTHLSYTGRMDVTTFNIRTAAEIAVKHGGKGILLTDWGNAGHAQFAVWSYVPIALCGQYGWNTGAEQDGETFKADFIRNSEKYVDEEIFGGVPVSRLLYRMGNYYLLEPERVHVGTMCGELFRLPLNESRYAYFYDIKECGDEFYFNNVTEYVNKVLSDIKKLDFDEQLKSEIILNSEMVILSSELCKIRMGYKFSNEKLDELIVLSDRLAKEFYELWIRRNFEKGVEIFKSQIETRKNELVALKK